MAVILPPNFSEFAIEPVAPNNKLSSFLAVESTLGPVDIGVLVFETFFAGYFFMPKSETI